jgi:very-short-patch-repair endonuclease
VAPVNLQQRAVALGPLLGPDQRFSHLSAAELWGMRLPEGRTTQLHVTYRYGARAMRRPGVVGHIEGTVLAEVRMTPSGVPASAPVDAWCESAALLTIDELIVMGDGLVSRRNPVATLDCLIDAVDARSGRRGTARLRIALQSIRANSDSARETMLRLAVTRAGFPEPRVNAPLRDTAGRVIAHGDLVWSEFRVVLEYEGRQHAEDPAQFAIDIRRLDRIAEAGYRVIRVDRQLMAARAELVSTIKRALTAGGWRAP